jgi:hypothetical protein
VNRTDPDRILAWLLVHAVRLGFFIYGVVQLVENPPKFKEDEDE